MKIPLLAPLLALCLVGCSSIKVTEYKNEKPDFDLFQFFNGKAEANGIFQDRSGKVIKRMLVHMNGRIEGQTLIVDEDFAYSDGTTAKRTWKFTKGADGRIQGEAPDVPHVDFIETSGFAFNMKYTLRLPYNDSTIDVKMDDWMYRINEKQIINKTEMSKFGFHLGSVTLTIDKK